MWREDGRIVQYVYHPDQPGENGEDFPWEIAGKAAKLIPGKWQNLKTQIIMNTPGQKNGIIRSWLDGVLALEIKTLRFRDIPSIGIDAFYFSTFFGGRGLDWAPPKDVYAFFDTIRVEE